MKVLLTGDWHPDAVTAGFPRFDDAARAAEEAVEAAIRAEVDLFVFDGDLCDPDGGRALECSALSIRLASRLRAADVHQVWMTGNHDVEENGRGTSTLEPLSAYLEEVGDSGSFVASAPAWWTLEDVGFVFLPYVARSHAYEPAAFVAGLPVEFAELERVVVVAHLMLAGISPGSESKELARGRDLFFPIDEVLARFGDRALMFCGHYHRRQVHRGVRIVGSLERLTFGEGDSEPGWTLVEAGR